MKTSDLLAILEHWAPKDYQESYDNSGLIIGNKEKEISNVLISLDCTEEVLEEAMQLQADMILCHHPLIFSPIKRIAGGSPTEIIIEKAIKSNISIYAIHTNLDNIATGVNYKLANKLGVLNPTILDPKPNLLRKLVTYIPIAHFDVVSKAIFEAGAGTIGDYSYAGFAHKGTGTFIGNDHSQPFLGQKNQMESVEEMRFETIFPSHLQEKIMKALRASHPYEEVAYDILSLHNTNQTIGAGMIGKLPEPIAFESFMSITKQSLNLKSIKYTPIDKKVQTIAFCGGSGSFLRHIAKTKDADVFISADFKYHEFFDATKNTSFIDIGHYESEQFTKELIFEYLEKNALSLQSQISKVNTNPIKYY